MIKGITHDQAGVLHRVTKFAGKISTGFAPGEGPNKENHPVPAGFFRLLKEHVVTQRVGASQKEVVTSDWVLNEQLQTALEAANRGSKTPRKLEIVSLFKTPDEFWESSMSMYNATHGLMCTSNGEGTNARMLIIKPNGDREWVNRLFDGRQGCLLKACPDCIADKCKPIGLMKCFPTIALSPNPYRFETRSINTIIGIESSLGDIWSLVKASHAIVQLEAGCEVPFDGMFGMKIMMVHRKIKSGGRDVYITDVMPTKEMSSIIMDPIQRWLKNRAKADNLIGARQMSLLECAVDQLSDKSAVSNDMDIDDEIGIANTFTSDSPTQSTDDGGAESIKSVITE